MLNLTNNYRWQKLVVAILIIAFIGFLDAAYLAIEHIQGRLPSCSIVDGCEQVLTSRYAELGSIPLSVFGVLFYLSVFGLAQAWRATRKFIYIKLLLLASLAGFIVSMVLLYIQGNIIGSYCQFCLLSVVTSTLIFILVANLYYKINSA